MKLAIKLGIGAALAYLLYRSREAISAFKNENTFDVKGVSGFKFSILSGITFNLNGVYTNYAKVAVKVNSLTVQLQKVGSDTPIATSQALKAPLTIPAADSTSISIPIAFRIKDILANVPKTQVLSTKFQLAIDTIVEGIKLPTIIKPLN